MMSNRLSVHLRLLSTFCLSSSTGGLATGPPPPSRWRPVAERAPARSVVKVLDPLELQGELPKPVESLHNTVERLVEVALFHQQAG